MYGSACVPEAHDLLVGLVDTNRAKLHGMHSTIDPTKVLGAMMPLCILANVFDLRLPNGMDSNRFENHVPTPAKHRRHSDLDSRTDRLERDNSKCK